MKYACRYAIVRFMPHPETGEFANVGIVLMSPDARFFGFRMMVKGISRITSFFDDLDVGVFRNARNIFSDELKRIQTTIEHAFAGIGLKASDPAYVDYIFSEMTRPRGAIMYLDETRVILAEDPAKKLNELFEYYIYRSFVRTPNYEQQVEKRVQNILKNAALASVYHLETLGGETYHARFPFVRKAQNGEPTHAIKPIDLSQQDATRLYDHGWDWVGKVRMLRRQNHLPPNVLFAAEPPSEEFGPRASAYAEIRSELERLEVQIARPNDQETILAFARSFQ